MDYRATFEKDPFDVVLDVATMRKGDYLIKGDVAKENFFKACDVLKVPHEGKCAVEMVMTIEGRLIRLRGVVDATLTLTCSRTLESFSQAHHIEFDERVAINEEYADDETDYLDTGTLDVADYITQQLALNMDPYPIHPNSLTVERGAFNMEDGLEEQVKEESNPFAALKNLK